MQNSVATLAASNPTRTLRLGTRSSQLALWQTNHVIRQLQAHWPHLQCELVHMVTQGDRRLDRPLPEIGGKGLFTAELEEALRQGDIDLAVHSLKDLPVEDSPGVIIGAILSREDTRDVLVARNGWKLATLPEGAIVGTSSLRRQAQLLVARPDLDVRPIRGNVDTRLRKVLEGEYDAAVMAAAGFVRLGLVEHITEWLAPNVMVPAPGQGALAIQCRADDATVYELLSALHDPQAAATTTAERQLLWHLGGGCSAPVGASAQFVGGQLTLHARVATVDGLHVFDAEASGSDAHKVANQVADLLLKQGAHVALVHATRTRPLAGKKIVVTRPNVQSATQRDDLAAQLRSVGAEPLEIPAIHIAPVEYNLKLQAAIERIATYDWVVFTSPNAVEFFFSALAESGASLTDSLQPKIAAVGPATEAALQAYGLHVHTMPEKYLGREIAATLGDIQGAHILLPRSVQGSSELPNALVELEAVVDEVSLYAPVPITLDAPAFAALAAGVDVVTFASGSAVRAFVATLRNHAEFATQHLADFWSNVTVACIGPSTAEVAQAEGLTVHVVASEHTVPGLVAALITHYEQGA
jgi:hydroxymethylbilane synthase